MKKRAIILLSLAYACGQFSIDKSSDSVNTIKSGTWLFSFDLGSEKLPFNAFYSNKENQEILVIKNGLEVIKTEAISHQDDSVFFTLPVFGTMICAKITSDTSIEGYWLNSAKSNNYKIPIKGVYGVEERFSYPLSKDNFDFSGKWDVTFSPEKEQPCKAIGIFEQNDNSISGTFLTETGDYRFLEGLVSGNEMSLSCFDGAHAFLFKAKVNSEGEIEGKFLSGNHWSENWIGHLNNDIELSHPDSITHILDAEPDLSMSFPDLDNNSISLDNEEYNNKVLILQIMGTWCPNCADESRDFAMLYDRYKDHGLEIIAISYESTDDFIKASKRIKEFKKETHANYTFLFAGKANKKLNSEDFKMINGISSYPTAIFLDRNGKIRKVHTGYYGPGTGDYYLKYKEDTEMFIQKLLSEEPISS